MRNHPIVLALVIVFCGWNVALGQAFQEDAIPTSPRIVQPIDEGRLFQLRGNTHPQARREFDRGIVAPDLPMERMLLLLQRSPQQEADLEAFMARQLDPASPDFHHWLEPVEFGRIYGPAQADIVTVTNWLQNHGFTVDDVSNGRVFIEFSGTAGLVQEAFHTEIHRYNVKGVEHIANSSDPSIPEALSPVVAGVVSLHDFFAQPLHRDLGSVRRDSKSGKWIPENKNVVTRPLFNPPPADAPLELVSPYDFATIYNVLPLWTAGIDGTGETIAIAGRSDISLTDVATFRSAFGLPAKAPTIIVNGPDPGVPTAGDKVENTLDVEWSNAVAKGATVKFVTTKSTTTTDGAQVSALYIIDNKVAPIMSFSYGNCELAFGTAGNAAYNSMWQQGATEGISEFVASGDQGSAACDGGQTAPYAAEFGLAVGATSSTPYDVAVGGTDFIWANSATVYWNTTNAADGLSALGYIPEVPWNDTCASVDVDTLFGFTPANGISNPEAACQYMLVNDFDIDLVNVAGGTGGKSACTTPSSNTVASCSGGYAKPSWQTGTGVPADGKRDVPDVSLFASNGALNTAYVICVSASAPCIFTNANDAIAQAIGGTSVASPAMAGIMALVLQKTGDTALGLPNPVFYKLAAKDNLTTCKSNTVAKGNSCIFYDVTSDNNQVPCNPGFPNCTVINTGDEVGIINGYNATTGYDLTTGLGSVNATNLVNGWSSVQGPAVSVFPVTLAFPDTTIGTSSALKTVTITNTGTATVTAPTISIIGTDPSSFTQTNTCGSLLKAASCTISVTFKPATASRLTASLNIADIVNGSPQKVALSGTGTDVSLSPATLAFGTVTTSKTLSVTVKNVGAITLAFSKAPTITGSGAAKFAVLPYSATGPVSTCLHGTVTLAQNATCTYSVKFTNGVDTTAFTAALNVFDNGGGSPQLVPLTGNGTEVTLTPTTLAFGTVTTNKTLTVTVKNVGTTTLDFSKAPTVTGTGAANFVVLPYSATGPVSTCLHGTVTLAQNATCTYSVKFTNAGGTTSFTSDLNIFDNGGGSPQLEKMTATD